MTASIPTPRWSWLHWRPICRGCDERFPSIADYDLHVVAGECTGEEEK